MFFSSLVVAFCWLEFAASESFLMKLGEHLDFEFFSTNLPQKVCWIVDMTSTSSNVYAFEYGTLSDVDYQRWKGSNFTRTFVFNYLENGAKCPVDRLGSPAKTCSRAFLHDTGAWLVVRMVSSDYEYIDVKVGTSFCPANLTYPITSRIADTTAATPPPITFTPVGATTAAPSDSRTLAAGQFEYFSFAAAPNKTETGVCFEVLVTTARAVAQIDIGILTGAEFARWKATNYATNYAFVGGSFCNDVLSCKKSIVVPDLAPVLVVHNTDVVTFSVIVRVQEAACPELFAGTTAAVATTSSTAPSVSGGGSTAIATSGAPQDESAGTRIEHSSVVTAIVATIVGLVCQHR